MCSIISPLVQIISIVLMEPQDLSFALVLKFNAISLSRVMAFVMDTIILSSLFHLQMFISLANVLSAVYAVIKVTENVEHYRPNHEILCS